ncbi:MAG: S8 family peptidase, partial [Bifidobacterium mongoliense]
MLNLEYPSDGDDDRIGQITRIERIGNYSLADKLHETPQDHEWHELVLHLVDKHLAPDNLNDFLVLAGDLDIEVEDQLNFQTSDLLYLPARGDEADIRHLAEYSTVRAVRPMPRLKLEPVGGDITRQVGHPTRLPDPNPEIHEAPAVAVFDGGIPESNPLSPWIGNNIKANPEATDVAQYTSHGLAVCSALLFGNLNLQQPPLHTRITVVRVLDDDTRLDDPLNLYKTLDNIETVLASQRFEYVNLSLGPDMPIEDDEVSAWTSVLDNILSSSDTLLSVAVGNNGDLDDASGNNRIEPPGDAVNALCAGAADSEGLFWGRASYSAVGPGRSPGIVK